MKLKLKITLGFSAIIMFFLANVIINICFIENSKKSVTEMKEVNYKQLEYAADINTSVIQIQQFLSDASLTKKTDSIKEAEKYKEIFKESIKKLENINPNMKDKIKKIDEDFDKYYEIGNKMTNAYIYEGYEKGNMLMDQFDPMAVSLTNAINELNKYSKDAMDNNLQGIYKEMNKSMEISIALGIISLILAVVIVVILGSSITEPINNMFNILQGLEVGEGDLTKRIAIKSNDEIGMMSKSFNNFMDNLERMVKNIKQNSGIVLEGSKILSDSSINVKNSTESIDKSMKELERGSEIITDSVNEVSASSASISQSSQTTTNNIQDICIKTGEINGIAAESGKLAEDAKVEMDKIENISVNAMAINEKLGYKAEEIKEIIYTIQSIADQTNLLALNASIESSRAGEQGKGFAVVADEIRKLAENNSESSKTIENLINSIHEMIAETINSTSEMGLNVKRGGKMVEDVFTQLQKIIEGVNYINNKIQSITLNSEEQSASIEELTATMESISSSNAEISDEIKTITDSMNQQVNVILSLSGMTQKLNSSANELGDLVNKFKISDVKV